MQARLTYGLTQTHGMLSQDGVQRRYSSEGRGWTSLFASTQTELPFDGQFEPVEDQLIVWHRNGPVEIEGEGGARRFCRTVPAGGMHLIPGGAAFSIRLASELNTMHVYVRRKVLVEVAADMVIGDPEKVTIRPGVLDADIMLLALLRPVEMVLESGLEGGLSADYLAHSLAAHLIEHYSDARLRPTNRTGQSSGLSPLAARAVSFMRDNLDRSIGLEEIASAVDRSTSHIARVFKTDLGTPPHRYLVQLRVEKAQDLLTNTDLPIAEIAVECGFTHQEHLTHQFRRLCATTPAVYRRTRRS